MKRFDLLIVEDEPIVRRAIARLLAPEALTLEAVDGVSAAIERLEGGECAAVLADLMLPERSGLELLEWARRERPRLPVIMITGYATVENALASLRLGAFDYLPKPFDEAELLGVVIRAMAWSRQPAQTRPPASREPAGDAPREELGEHAWAIAEADGSFRVGAGASFAGLLTAPLRVDLPHPGAPVTIGRRLARITDGRGLVHRVTAPVGGVVLAHNPRLAECPELIGRDPLGDGWLVRIAPTAPRESASPNLSPPAIDSTTPDRR